MNLFKVFSAVFFCILLPSILLAQGPTGKVLFVIHPPDAILMVDSTKIDQRREPVEFPTGTYRVQVWGPTLTYLDTTITVIADSTVRFKGLLRHSNEYKAWALQDDNNRMGKRTGIILTLSGIGVAGGFFAEQAAYNAHLNNLEDEIEEARTNYDRAVSLEEIETTRAEFEDLRTRHQRSRVARATIGTVLLSGSAVLLGGATFQFVKYSQKKPGPFQETPRITQVEIGVHPNIVCGANLGVNVRF